MAAFIILAHRNPEQVARLAKRLAPHYVFIHIDSKLDDATYDEFFQLLKDSAHVKFITRHRSAWASWGIVKAALEGIKAALSFNDWSHVMVLSGQDYPLMSSAQMEVFFNDHIDKSFVLHWHLPCPLWGKDGGDYRTRFWHTPFRGKRFFLPIARKQPDEIKHVGGPMFSCLNREMAKEVATFADRKPKIANFYRNVWIPDEMYIPTVVMNSIYKDSVVNEALTYIRWSNPGSPHPDELTINDLTELICASNYGSSIGGYARRKLFARKVYMENQSELLDLLDQVALTD